jgi:hypothetical protein
MKSTKISQSLLKSLFNYKQGTDCGIKIKAHYLDGMEYESSDAMALGNWFEYKATGQLPRNGVEPLPETLKNGDLSVAYRRMSKQIENYQGILDTYNIKILETGYHFKHEFGSGIADIIAEWNGQKCIIDLKTTGKIDDKWSEYGWGDEKFEYVDSPNTQHLTIQAVQYKLLAREEWGEDVPFYFFVFSTTDEDAMKIFRVEVDPDRIDKHLEQIKSAYSFFNNIFINKTDEDLAFPELKRCKLCPLKTNCKYAVEVPLIKTIQVY